jgi:subtilase family serine protease
MPAAATWQQISADEQPPTQDDCYSFGIRCFVPESIAKSYNYAVLHAAGNQGQGITVAIIDSFGSETIRHDLHVFNQTFGLQPMCGEEGVTCQPGMPTFSILDVQGSPASGATPPNRGTGLEEKFGWAVETSLDVEWVHATAPKANILLVTTPTAETLGVQGFPTMMNALQYVIDNDLADVVSMSFGAAEGTFHNGLPALEQLRGPMVAAKARGITLLASSGDFGSFGFFKGPPKNPAPIAYPSISWPASDPLVTAVGGTRLCTDSKTGVGVDTVNPPDVCQPDLNTLLQRETGWIGSGGGYSILFPRPAYQNALPPGSSYVGSSVGAPPPNQNMRGIPDIAYQASGGTAALVFVDSFWFTVGGTSVGAPQWAGLIALADQIAGRRLGHVSPALYQIANNPAKYASDFFDVTVGCNQLTDVPGYCASTGWDAVTGLGTPNAANLLPDLIAATP